MYGELRLETQRLVLRPLSLADAAAIQQYASNRSVADTTISIPHPYPDGEAEKYIAKQIAEQKQGHSVTFAIAKRTSCVIALKPKSDLIGVVKYRDIELEHSAAELTYWLAVTAWGKGYMSEALKPMLRFGFETLTFNKIYAYHMVRNQASGRVLQKNGFVLEGLLRQRIKKWENSRM